MVTLRLPESFKHWFDQYLKEVGLTRTEVLRELLEALSEHRLIVLTKSKAPLIFDGRDPAFALQIGYITQ